MPLGYDAESKRLVINPAEAATVRLIFERYVALGCVARLKAELDARGIVSKVRGHTTGRRIGGKPFSRGALYRLLANRVYIGEAVHKGKAHPGEHEPIIDRALFAAVQDSLAGRRVARLNGARAAEPNLLGGLLLDAQGERMSPSHAVKNNKRYRYYTSQALLQSRSRRAGHATRVPAHDIEAVVTAEVRSLLQDPGALLDMLAGVTPDLAEQQVLLQAAAALAARWPSLTPAEVTTLVRAVVGRVIMRDDQLDIELSPACLRDVLLTGPDTVPAERGGTSSDGVTVSIDVRLKRGRGGEIKLIVPARSPGASPSSPNSALIRALVHAHHCHQLRSGQASSLRQFARTERLTKHYVARIFPLVFLAPDIQVAILDGAQPPELTLDQLCQPLPLTWSEQRQVLGFEPLRSPGEYIAPSSCDGDPAPSFANDARRTVP